MLKSTTLELPGTLIAKAKDYASQHRTTLTALVIEQLEALTSSTNEDPLVMFSRGLLSKEETVRAIGVRDYSELLMAMGDADLPLPSLPDAIIEEQIRIFADLWSVS